MKLQVVLVHKNNNRTTQKLHIVLHKNVVIIIQCLDIFRPKLPDILGFGQTKCPNKLCDFPDKLHNCLIKITFVQTMCQHILLFISSTDNNNNNTIGLHYIMFPFLQPTVHKCTNVFLLVLGGSKRVPDIDITQGLQCYYLYVHTYMYRCTLYVE